MEEKPVRKTEGISEGSRIQGRREVQTGNDQECPVLLKQWRGKKTKDHAINLHSSHTHTKKAIDGNLRVGGKKLLKIKIGHR